MQSLLRAALIFTALVSACVPDASYLDDRLYQCAGPADCGEDWGCVRAAPYASDFCAPDCDPSTCDGVCVQQNGGAQCVRGCRFDAEGIPSECPASGFECIRVSAETDEGICYPVTSCGLSSECPEGQRCLAEVIGAGPTATGSYCVPEPNPGDGSCPARSRSAQLFLNQPPVCMATCNPPDNRCPPSFGCLEQASVLGGDEEVLCFPGVYGVSCEDDTNCLLGRCIDTGEAGKQCTLSCDEAGRLAGGCGGVLSLADFTGGALAFECESDTPEGPLCVTRSGIGFVCTTPESDAYVCQRGLSCESFRGPNGDSIRLCTRSCEDDAQCNSPGRRENFCRQFPVGNTCLPALPDGEVCTRAGQCRSGVCDGVCLGGSTI